MKKELSGPMAIILVVGILVIILGAGWFLINREPGVGSKSSVPGTTTAPSGGNPGTGAQFQQPGRFVPPKR